MKRHIIILLFTCAFFIPEAVAQESKLTSKDLGQISGKWKGTLTYLDYSSGKSYSMPADLEVSRIRKTDQYIFFHSYPDEPKANGADTIIIPKAGNMIGEEHVVSRMELENGTVEIITEYESKDGNDNKPATIRHTYMVSKTDLVIRKEIKFAGKAEWIKRNEYKYSKK